MRLPRILIAAGKSGSGKTTVVCGLLRALQRRGLRPAAFKCGPDYIDPMFHQKVVKAASGNLDPFFAGEELLRWRLAEGAAGADLAVLEGVMGYYDGLGGYSVRASSYDAARMTETPVVLVLDGKGMSRSALAWLAGLCRYQKDSRIAGVIFNRMSEGVYRELKPLAEKELSIACIGFVPELPDCHLQSRHLGLVLPNEIPELSEQVDRIAGVLERTLDLELLCGLAREAPELPEQMPSALRAACEGSAAERIREARPVVAVARDEAFCFCYPENLELLRRLGAQLRFFSPVHDAQLPPHADGLLLYGGYPELYAEQLEANRSMRESVREAVVRGVPCMAECGGFLYLSERLEGMDGALYEMAGALPGLARRQKRLGRFGYVLLSARTDAARSWSAKPLRAHEFHYYDSTDCGSDFRAEKPLRSSGWECMHASETLLAGFPHFYYCANPELAVSLLEKCCDRKRAAKESGRR